MKRREMSGIQCGTGRANPGPRADSRLLTPTGFASIRRSLTRKARRGEAQANASLCSPWPCGAKSRGAERSGQKLTKIEIYQKFQVSIELLPPPTLPPSYQRSLGRAIIRPAFLAKCTIQAFLHALQAFNDL